MRNTIKREILHCIHAIIYFFPKSSTCIFFSHTFYMCLFLVFFFFFELPVNLQFHLWFFSMKINLRFKTASVAWEFATVTVGNGLLSFRQLKRVLSTVHNPYAGPFPWTVRFAGHFIAPTIFITSLYIIRYKDLVFIIFKLLMDNIHF